MKHGYSVTVFKAGEPLVTIEPEMLSGNAELSDEDADAIRDAAEHLLCFIGPKFTRCFVCGGFGNCEPDCALSTEPAA